MSETVIAGRYRLDELLGRSGMSEVWRAEDLELGRDVALKLLAPNADTARFEREARAVASLAHPNVMQLYDYGESDGRPYMVLEYVPDGTLEDRLRERKALPDDETYAIAAGMAAGLAHAHARGVVHRDLKPANVLFDQEGRPKLGDFGIARMEAGEGTLTEAGTILGTAAYISPEQAMGEPATAASDVYSFGVMLYRMLTGRLPFESNDPMELALLHRDAPPPPLTEFRPDVPAALAATTAAALSKNPAGRPPDGATLLAELGVPGDAGLDTATALATDATRVLPAPDYTDPGPPPAPRRAPLIVGALLVLGLAGGAVAYEVTRPASSPAPADTSTQVTLPTSRSTQQTTTTAPTTTPTTAPSTQSTTQQTATQPTTQPVTTLRPQPVTTAAPPVTTAAPPPTTTAPPTTDTAAATTAP